jgi:hypothetical protein
MTNRLSKRLTVSVLVFSRDGAVTAPMRPFW